MKENAAPPGLKGHPVFPVNRKWPMPCKQRLLLSAELEELGSEEVKQSWHPENAEMDGAAR